MPVASFGDKKEGLAEVFRAQLDPAFSSRW
jgi:hypothetical protein